MAKTVAVVDYGMGNLRSVSQAVKHVAQGSGFDVVVTSSPQRVLDADRVVLPGQGAMPDCMHQLQVSGLQGALQSAAASKPLLGVCVGMQMLLEHSEEGPTNGLMLISGTVLRLQPGSQLQPDGSRYKVPQIGWNQVSQARAHPLWTSVPNPAYFYFVHSYYVQPSDTRHIVGETEYGGRFTSAVARDNIFATQFHPEKSSQHGLSIYKNFLMWRP